MSVVVAYIKDDIVYFGCDNRMSMSDDYQEISFKKGYKLQRYRDYVIGFVGATPLNIKAYDLVKKFKCRELTKEYLIKNFYKEIMKVNKEYKSKNIQERGASNLNSAFMIAKGNRLYLINSEGVTRIKHYASMGSGYNFVLPYLYNMDETNINKMMKEGMEACAAMHSKVGGPYHFINTKDLKLETEE